MGTNKKYSGYQSFDYLEKGKDYKEFKLIEGENAFEPYLIPLSPEQEGRVEGHDHGVDPSLHASRCNLLDRCTALFPVS